MTALGIRYLMGAAVAADGTRQHCEFPPHPGRVFMAMAAAHFETGGGPEERRALEWIEDQSEPPAISHSEFNARQPSKGWGPVETYVPVNDKHSGIAGRSRQARSFPTVHLDDEKLFLVWSAEAPHDIRSALDKLCAKVTRIGHSSSLVQMWVADEPREIQPSLIADQLLAQKRLRVPEPGTLAYLENTFAQGDRPRLASWHGYRSTKEDISPPTIEGPFHPNLIIFEKFEGRVLGLEATIQLTGALRKAAMTVLPQGQSPEWLTGHQPDGSPSTKPHVAFLPLPFVDFQHADGHILGMALAIPKAVPLQEARPTIGSLLFNPESGEERTIKLWSGSWEWQLKRETRDRPPLSLRAETWTEPHDIWASVTPVVLHHYPKKNRGGDVERILNEAFVSAGFPQPRALRIRPASAFKGPLGAREIPSFTEGAANGCPYQTHVEVKFDTPVKGPVLVGRGRYRGYGLFRPLKPKPERS